MADEEKTGQPISPPVAAPITGEPKTQVDEPAPQGGQPPTTLEIPEKFKGKSLEEVAASYLEVEKELGRQRREAGELRQNAERLYYELLSKQAQTQPQPPQQEKTEGEFNWEKPVETVEQIFDRKQAEREAIQANFTRQNAFQRAAYAHEQGRASMSKNPKLFGGIENEVERYVYNSLLPHVQRGEDVSSALLNPKTWEGAAALYWIDKGQHDRLSFATQPMSAQAGEIPSQTRQSQSSGEEIPITDDIREYAKAWGLENKTPKELRELIGLGDENYQGTRRR